MPGGKLSCRLDQDLPLTLFVTEEEAGERLDAFLATQIEGWSRSRLQRLNEDAGVLVVAKTGSAHEDLADQFRTREVFKSYVALVHGQVERDTGRIDQPIARDPHHRTRMAIVRGGRPALSIYRVSERFDKFTRLDVELKTGRTHQIRVHLAWIKYPVVGDEVYGSGRDKTVADPR